MAETMPQSRVGVGLEYILCQRGCVRPPSQDRLNLLRIVQSGFCSAASRSPGHSEQPPTAVTVAMTTQPLGKAPTAASDVVATTVKPVNHQEAVWQLTRQPVDLRKLLDRCEQVGGDPQFRLDLERIEASKKSKLEKKNMRDALRMNMQRWLETESTQVGEPPPTASHASFPQPGSQRSLMSTAAEPCPSLSNASEADAPPVQPEKLTPLDASQDLWSDDPDTHDPLCNDPAFAITPPVLETGGHAVITGLLKRTELNNSEVVLLHFFEDRSRWGVRCLDGSQLSVKPECLTPMQTPAHVQAMFEGDNMDYKLPNVRGERKGPQHIVEDQIDMDAAEAAMIAMLKRMGVSVPFGRPFTREEAWRAAHESNVDAYDIAHAQAHADGEPLCWDDIPEHEKDWRNFV